MVKKDTETKELEVLGKQDLTKTIEIVKQGIRKYLSKEEVNELLSTVPAGSYKMLLSTMWMTGLRVTEIISIRKQDINWNDNLMRVRWLKNRKFYERIIPVKRELKELLQLYTMKLKAEDIIFPISRQRVWQICKKYDKRIHPHTLRHCFAVNCLKNGMSIVVLSRLLGHSNINTTMEYLRIVPLDQAKELEAVQFM